MTLALYMKDLLRQSSSSTVSIVDDNPYVLQDESLRKCELKPETVGLGMEMGPYTRSSSLRDFIRPTVGLYDSQNKKPSRWVVHNRLPRNKSDSALGKPKRRSSASNEEIWTNVSVLLNLDLDATSEADETETTTRTTTTAAKTTTNIAIPSSAETGTRSSLVATVFTGNRGKRSRKSEQESIQNTFNRSAANHRRSRFAPFATSRQSVNNADVSCLSAPKPARRLSSDEFSLESAARLTLYSSEKDTSRTASLGCNSPGLAIGRNTL